MGEKRYSEIYNYRGKKFRYDYKDSIVEYGFINDESDFLGKEGEFIEVDCVGLRKENWENKGARNEYLNEWIIAIDYELQFLI